MLFCGPHMTDWGVKRWVTCCCLFHSLPSLVKTERRPSTKSWNANSAFHLTSHKKPGTFWKRWAATSFIVSHALPSLEYLEAGKLESHLSFSCWNEMPPCDSVLDQEMLLRSRYIHLLGLNTMTRKCKCSLENLAVVLKYEAPAVAVIFHRPTHFSDI